MEKRLQRWQLLAYSEDAKDGRPESGLAVSCCAVSKTVKPGKTERFQIVFSMENESLCGWEMLEKQEQRLKKLEQECGFADPAAKQLALAADAFIAHRDSTNCKTILAGYPLFSDWGRDTMIALPGCCLATGRYEDAKSILRTFLAYEKDGLVPNLFPEGETQPMYNTEDAALLLGKELPQHVGIDARHRHVSTDAVHNQCEKEKEQTIFKVAVLCPSRRFALAVGHVCFLKA